MTTRVVLVASTRTGSSWLASLLDSHPTIRFRGELFNLERAPLEAIRDPLAYLDAQLVPPAGVAAVGFKLLQHQARAEYLNDFLAELDQGRPSQVDWRRHFPARPVGVEELPALPALWDALRQGAWKVIHLQRRDLLRQRISHERLMAGSRSRWRGPLAPARPLRLAADRLVDELERHTREVGAVRAFFAGAPLRDVAYEDLLADAAAQQRQLLAFLGVPAAPLRSALSRRAPRPLREELANYGEVARALAGTRWAALLDG